MTIWFSVLAYFHYNFFNDIFPVHSIFRKPNTTERGRPIIESAVVEKNGDWTQAHETTQEIHTKEAALVHAYLHRRESDLSNANYWYRTARVTPFKGTMDEEWNYLVNNLK